MAPHRCHPQLAFHADRAGLFLRSFGRLTHVPLGFDSGRVLLAEIDARRADLAGCRCPKLSAAVTLPPPSVTTRTSLASSCDQADRP